MKPRLIATLAGLLLAGAASAQTATPMDQTPLFAQARQHGVAAPVRVGADELPALPPPPLPPGCLDERVQRPTHPVFPDFTKEARWRDALGISTAQARQVQQLFESRQKDDRATCRKLRDIVGDKAMDRWSALSALPPPPPPPPAPDAPRPPDPPAPPPAPDDVP